MRETRQMSYEICLNWFKKISNKSISGKNKKNTDTHLFHGWRHIFPRLPTFKHWIINHPACWRLFAGAETREKLPRGNNTNEPFRKRPEKKNRSEAPFGRGDPGNFQLGRTWISIFISVPIYIHLMGFFDICTR